MCSINRPSGRGVLDLAAAVPAAEGLGMKSALPALTFVVGGGAEGNLTP
jgi:hypothetical protein